MNIVNVSAHDVESVLDYGNCIEAVRMAMIELSAGRVQQMPRQILPLSNGMFGIMAGTCFESFGSKLLCVRPNNAGQRLPTHQGIIVLFDAESGAIKATVDASAVTAIRTAATTAVATAALARDDARVLTIVGTGEQAHHHALALLHARPFSEIRFWGRTPARVQELADRVARETGVSTTALERLDDAVAPADVIVTVTSAAEPVLLLDHVAPGVHVNAVGSSHARACEIGSDLVAGSLYFGDSRDSVFAQGAEFLRAQDAGLIDRAHFRGEIGEVLAGRCEGRTAADQRTLFKSLGHIVQDICAAEFVFNSLKDFMAGREGYER